MLLLAIILCLIETQLTFDFPIPFDRAEVAFHERRHSKYYDLVSSQWRDTDEGFKLSYNQILRFCQAVYPDRDIIQIHQGSQRTLTFCSTKDASKCSDKETVTWVCVSREDHHSVFPTATPASTASRQVTTRCYNETRESITYDTCTLIQSVVDFNYCSDNNLTVNKMDNVKTCNITDQDGGESNGLLSADLQCCSKVHASEREGYRRPDIATIPRGPNNNPFRLPDDSIYPTFKPNVNLPKEWCQLEYVEKQYKNMTDANLELMKQIYAQTESNDGNIDDDLMLQLEAVRRDKNEQVVQLYTGHFNCLVGTVQELVDRTKLSLDLMAMLKDRDSFATNIANVNVSLHEVNATFHVICTRLVSGNSNDFTNEYRTVVTRLQELRLQIESIGFELEEQENCVECQTDGGSRGNTHPPFNVVTVVKEDEEEEDEEDGSKLRNQKYLIAIVSTVSCITILVALVFFILVVRRTLHKDVSGRFTTLPSADILTNEQYVAFLQKNGYANPTCRLPQKYLDDHD